MSNEEIKDICNPVGWVIPSVMKEDGFCFTASESLAKSWMVWSENVKPVYFHTQEDEIARLRNELASMKQQIRQLKAETGFLEEVEHTILGLQSRISQLEAELESERAANEQLTHDCEIARQHLLKAISEKDNGHV